MIQYILPTFTGIEFDLLNPTIDMIDIRDIAHHLSYENRFNGATIYPYSVAQHSIYMAQIAPDEFKLEYLLHDAEEAYYKDLPAPLKKIIAKDMSAYECMTYQFMDLLQVKTGISKSCGRQLVMDDKRMGVTEIRQLLIKFDESKWMLEYQGKESFPITIERWRPEDAEAKFLQCYERYKRS